MRQRNVWWGLALALSGAAQMACAAPAAYDSGGTGTAARFVSSADRAAYHGRYSEALADDDKALKVSPAYGVALLDRANHEMDAGLYDAARADYDRVTAMHPDDMRAMWRAATPTSKRPSAMNPTSPTSCAAWA